ncbi:MAG: CBS domain-containing protein [Myxococcota bacterium]
MHSVRDVIRNRSLVAVNPEQSVYSVAVTMTEAGVGAVPVIEGDRLVGIFSERDLLVRVVVPGRDPDAVQVAQVMTRDVITADIGDRTHPCMEKMRARNCRHLPVISDGRVIAMLSTRDFLRDELEERDEEIRNLRAYLHQDGPH